MEDTAPLTNPRPTPPRARVALKTKLILFIIVFFYCTSIVGFLGDAAFNNHNGLPYSAAAVMFATATITPANYEYVMDSNFMLRQLVSPAIARFCSSFGPVTGPVVGIALAERQIVYPWPLSFALFSAHVSAFFFIVHGRPLNTDFGILNALCGLNIGYCWRQAKYLGFWAYAVSITCASLVLLRGWIEKTTIEGVEAAAAAGGGEGLQEED